jgi:hypothetical protein
MLLVPCASAGSGTSKVRVVPHVLVTPLNSKLKQLASEAVMARPKPPPTTRAETLGTAASETPAATLAMSNDFFAIDWMVIHNSYRRLLREAARRAASDMPSSIAAGFTSFLGQQTGTGHLVDG